MQPKYTHNKSNIIKVTEEAKRKSRQRLIGSIILLFIALIILLNVTAKVKPIPINPDIVEIKNSTASAPLQTQTVGNMATNSNQIEAPASAPISQENSLKINASANIPVSNPTISNKINASADNSNNFKAAVVVKNTQALPLQGEIVKPKITTAPPIAATAVNKNNEKVKAKKNNPADILNGIDDHENDSLIDQATAKNNTQLKNNSYIQLAALSNEDRANQIQQTLSSHGIQTTIQPLKTANGTLYRLRAGPFKRQDAEVKLQKIIAAGYSGIITSK